EKKNLQEVSFKVAKKNIEIKSLRKIALLDIKNKKATKTIKRLAKRNLAWAQYLFSQVYKTKRPNTYKSYILMASKNRYNLACNEIGKAYLIGNKIFPKNPKTALAYFGISADQDDPEGLFLRGKLLFQGDKEFQGNQTDGSKYIRKSAEKGYTPAKTFMESGAWKSWDKATDQPNGSTTKAETGSEQTDDTEQQQDASQKNEENESNQEEETIPTSTQNGRRG
ncbi:MAG: hypothetical protein CMP10_18575, partial [Zetaproteobacteria bacterium]|nr:hypothetical protein [Pseudobdellovibrionaceae bacterium]